MGKQDYEEASKMAATGFFSALATGLLLCILGRIFLEPLSYLLGSTDTILPYTKAYLGVILLGVFLLLKEKSDKKVKYEQKRVTLR